MVAYPLAPGWQGGLATDEAEGSLHRDPVDRLLVAQSQLEGMPLVTLDPLVSQYSVDVQW